MQDTQTSGGVSAIPATLGDVAIVSSSSARLSHSHPAEDVMGLDDRIEAKRLEAMPEIVVEGEITLTSAANADVLGNGFSLPAGIYVGMLEAWYSEGSPKMKVDVGIDTSISDSIIVSAVNSNDTYTHKKVEASFEGDMVYSPLPIPFVFANRRNGKNLSVYARRMSGSQGTTIGYRVTFRRLI